MQTTETEGLDLSELIKEQQKLRLHPLFKNLKTPGDVRIFMQYHVFAVWDFMGLLKRLQKEIAPTAIPWRASDFSGEAVRLINEIVLAEESDRLPDGRAMSHFQIYLEAMEQAGASTALIRSYLKDSNTPVVPEEVKGFVAFHTSVASEAPLHEVAACFFYGREEMIPDLFSPLLKQLESQGRSLDYLRFYLQRHIELDGDEHGPLANKVLQECCAGEVRKIQQAKEMGIRSLVWRRRLWDFIGREIQRRRPSKKASCELA